MTREGAGGSIGKLMLQAWLSRASKVHESVRSLRSRVSEIQFYPFVMGVELRRFIRYTCIDGLRQ